MKGDKIDFSPLDPSRDHARWNGIVSSVVQRAIQARRRRVTVPVQLMAWSRPMLAAAAGLALVSWIGAMASSTKQETATASSTEPTVALSEWAETDQVPDTHKILEILGARDGTR